VVAYRVVEKLRLGTVAAQKAAKVLQQQTGTAPAAVSLQHTATHCSILGSATAEWHLSPCSLFATHCTMLQITATSCKTLQHTRLRNSRLALLLLQPMCIILQHTVTYCNMLQHTATYCNTLSGPSLDKSDILTHTDRT